MSVHMEICTHFGKYRQQHVKDSFATSVKFLMCMHLSPVILPLGIYPMYIYNIIFLVTNRNNPMTHQ